MEQYELDNILSNLQNYLETNGIRTNKLFHCINPNHIDHIPSMKYFDNDHKVYCYGCKICYDLIGAISAIENLNYKDAFKKAVDYYGNHTKQVKITKIPQKNNEKREKIAKNYKKAFDIWKNNLKLNGKAKAYLASRGISLHTAERFNLGFNNFDFGDKKLSAIVVPITENCYTARNIENEENGIRYYKSKDSHVELFNKEALKNKSPYCVITEGEFDCLSFETVGINALALGSANNTSKFIETDKLPNKTYILALDNDKAGQIATDELIAYFKENNIKYKTFDNCGFKDANEALVKDRNAFTQSIFSLIKKLQKQSAAEM